MKNLNLYKIWEVVNKLSERQDELVEDNVFVVLLGMQSGYNQMSFENFIQYYSFRIEDEYIIVFNDDKIPYEDYSTRDFSYVLIELLEISDEALDKWIEEEVDRQVYLEKLNKSAEKDRIREQIRQLTKQLEH